MAEKMTKANLFGSEYSLVGKSSGGGGAGMGVTTTNRWLRFNFDDPNHKSLRILKDTSFLIGDDLVEFEEDFIADFSGYISEEGCDYYVFLNKDKNIICGTSRDVPEGYIFIGQFHTLCADVGDNVTAIIPVEPGASVGYEITIQDYFKDSDLDFYNFYTKTATAVNDGTPYATITVPHPLTGFKAKDILPESVWCLNFHPKCKNWDGMVWCNGSNICVDIYLSSGMGIHTKSEYGAVHTVSRGTFDSQNDLRLIGKKFTTQENFVDYSMGSNQLTFIQGKIDHSTVGGHVDTVGRRMISFIGCEECCGYLWQRTSTSGATDNAVYSTPDERGLFGNVFDQPLVLTVGVSVVNSQTHGYIPGSRHINVIPYSIWTTAQFGNRGCSELTIV